MLFADIGWARLSPCFLSEEREKLSVYRRNTRCIQGGTTTQNDLSLQFGIFPYDVPAPLGVGQQVTGLWLTGLCMALGSLEFLSQRCIPRITNSTMV